MILSFMSVGSFFIGKVLGEKSYIGRFEILIGRYFERVCTSGEFIVSHPEIHSRIVYYF